ncbi:hypothetical protein [Mitsuaria sp. GD03876]|uniref:hypothetical protein n=1 Tax=Mitsuaria sp. GD03876 TaxID=2975399 RepID=UPI00244758B0|nr:hypothetical protein [Mitsuaria sp. GD03876]MDH0866629.1 hypothetical protein [Mitsuaria sp. GD03876]
MIKFNKTLSSPSTAALVTAGAVLSAVMMVAAPAFAAGASTKSDAQSTYEQERARCLSGQSGQARATCLKEAGAARQEAQRGRLKTASTQELANNAMLRCQRVNEDDREDCRRMVMGQGTRDGSVESGGILTRIDRMVQENPTAAGAPATPPSATMRPGPDVPPPRQPKASAPTR